MAGLTRSLFTLLTLLTLGSCTRPVGLRTLPEGPLSQASKLILDDDLSASDVKELLEALNEHGDLEGVAHYWRDPSEAELDAWGSWLTKFVLDSAGDPRGLIASVNRWVEQRRLSTLEIDMGAWSAAATFRDEREFLFATFLDQDFNALFERDYRLLNPAIWEAWGKAWKATLPKNRKENFRVESLVIELERFLSKDLRVHFEKVLADAAKKHAVPSLFDTAKYYRDWYGAPAFAVLDTGLNRMLNQDPYKLPDPERPGEFITIRRGKTVFSNQLEQLVAFAASANQSSHKMFSVIEQKLVLEREEGEALAAILEKWAIESLSELDTDNMLEGGHRALSLVPASMFSSVRKLLLNRFNLGNLSPIEQASWLDTFPGSENKNVRVMLRQYFDSVQAVGGLDVKDSFLPGAPKLFEAYRDLLRRTAAEDVGWLSSFYALAHQGKFFSLTGDTPTSDFWHGFVREGHGVQILRTVSAMDELPRIDFRDALQEALRGTDAQPRAGVALHLNWLKRAIVHREGIRATLERFFESDSKNPLLLDKEDWQFVERFAQEAGQRFPRDFFAKHSDRHQARKAVKALLNLAETGELARPIALLAHIDSPSMERVAEVLKKADASGELAAALRSLELFFAEPDALQQ